MTITIQGKETVRHEQLDHSANSPAKNQTRKEDDWNTSHQTNKKCSLAAEKPTRPQSSRLKRQRDKEPTGHLEVTQKEGSKSARLIFNKQQQVNRPRCCKSALVSTPVSSVTC